MNGAERKQLAVSEFKLEIYKAEEGIYQLKQGKYIQAEGSLAYCIDLFFERFKEQNIKTLIDRTQSGSDNIKVTLSVR